MNQSFQSIALFAKHTDHDIVPIFDNLVHFLNNRGHRLYIEDHSATLLPTHNATPIAREEMGNHADLVVVLGGDGSLLNAARAIVNFDVPILGINRGRLGFLADIRPDHFQDMLGTVLDGIYSLEHRTLLHTQILRENNVVATSEALNDTVLYNSDVARMGEFEVWIDRQFVLRQRADGLIVATPTGSTAYALSGGGPILYPTLNVFTLVPMLPHTLTSRPIVVDNHSTIELVVSSHAHAPMKLSCDGQVHFDLNPRDRVRIKKHTHELKLIHPKNHNYFEILRQKLGWSTDLSSDRFSATPKEDN